MALLELFFVDAQGQELGFVHRSTVRADTRCQFGTGWSLVCAKDDKTCWAALLKFSWTMIKVTWRTRVHWFLVETTGPVSVGKNCSGMAPQTLPSMGNWGTIMDYRLTWQFEDVYFPLQMMASVASDSWAIFSAIKTIQALLLFTFSWYP